MKSPSITEMITTIALVEIVTRIPIDNKKYLFQPVNTTVLPNAKVPASSSLIEYWLVMKNKSS